MRTPGARRASLTLPSPRCTRYLYFKCVSPRVSSPSASPDNSVNGECSVGQASQPPQVTGGQDGDLRLRLYRQK